MAFQPPPTDASPHLKPDVQAKLDRLAEARGSNPDSLASEAIEHFLDYDEWFVREVEKGVAQIDEGKVLSHAEVGKRIDWLLSQKSIASAFPDRLRKLTAKATKTARRTGVRFGQFIDG